MKILLVSDTHGRNDVLEQLYKCYPTLDLYLHAGDSEAYGSYALGPFVTVRGNCDYDYNLPNLYQVDTPSGKLVMKHVPYLHENEKKDTRIFIHGHTHKNEVKVVDNILYICPGSLSYSRNGPESYMIIDIITNKILINLRDLETHKTIYQKEIAM